MLSALLLTSTHTWWFWSERPYSATASELLMTLTCSNSASFVMACVASRTRTEAEAWKSCAPLVSIVANCSSVMGSGWMKTEAGTTNERGSELGLPLAWKASSPASGVGRTGAGTSRTILALVVALGARVPEILALGTSPSVTTKFDKVLDPELVMSSNTSTLFGSAGLTRRANV